MSYQNDPNYHWNGQEWLHYNGSEWVSTGDDQRQWDDELQTWVTWEGSQRVMWSNGVWIPTPPPKVGESAPVPPETPTVTSESPPSRGRNIIIGVVALVVLIGVIAGFNQVINSAKDAGTATTTTTPSPTPTVESTPDDGYDLWDDEDDWELEPDPKVTYRVTGASSASLTLTSKDGGTVQHSNKSLPWKMNFRAASGSHLYISAQNNGGGKITCEILLDGVRITKNTSTGQYAIATCSDFT